MTAWCRSLMALTAPALLRIMLRSGGVLLLWALCLPQAHAAGIVSEAYQLLMGPVLAVVLLLIICATAYLFMMGQLKSALVAIAILIFIVLVRHLVMGDGIDGGYFHDQYHDTSPMNIVWPVYGMRPESPVYQATQHSGHVVISGYAMMGATLLNRLVTGLFSLTVIGLILMIAMVMTIIQAARSQTVTPLLWFLMRLVILGAAALWPIVAITQSGVQSPVTDIFEQMSDTNDAHQHRRVPMIAALTFAGAIDLSERIGGTLQVHDGDLDTMIYTASRNAQLPADIVADYHLFADNCFTAILNLTYTPVGDDGTSGDLGELAEPFRHNAWSFMRDEVRARLEIFQQQPRYLQHALSAPAEMLFKDVDYEAYVINDDRFYMYGAHMGAAVENIFNDSFYVRRRGSPAVAPIMPWSPSAHRHGRVALQSQPWRIRQRGVSASAGGTVEMNRVGLLSGRVDAEKPSGAGSNLMIAPRLTGAHEISGREGRTRARLFCSLADYTDFNEDGSWRDQPIPLNRQPWTLYDDIPPRFHASVRTRDYTEYLRMRIASRYLSDRTSVQLCRAAAADPTSHPDFWGCLVAGRYNYPPNQSSVIPQTAARIQQRFETSWRDRLAAHTIGVDIPHTGIRPRMPLAVEAMHSLLVPRHQGSIPRAFTDMFLLAPALQRQMGMDVYGEGHPQEDGFEEESGWFYRLLTRIAGVALTGFASLFAWVAAIMTKVALTLYPHVIGLATLLLLLVYPVFAIMSFVPGKGGIILEWMKSVLWLCLWPIFIGIGVGLINQTGSYALADFFVQVDSVDISASVLQIFGSMFIFMAPTFAGMVLSLSFGALQQGVSGILGTGFKLAGVAALITGSLAALATTLVGGVVGAALGGAVGTARSAVQGVRGSPSGGGEKADGAGPGAPAEPGSVPAGVGQTRHQTPGFGERVMAGVRRGGVFGSRVATTATEIASAQAFAVVQGVDFTGGQFTQGGWAGIQAGHALQKGTMGRDGLIDAARDLGSRDSESAGQQTPRHAARADRGSQTHASAAMAIGDERRQAAAQDPVHRQQLLGESAAAYGQAQEAYAEHQDWGAAAHAGQQAFQGYMEAGDFASAQRVGSDAIRHAEQALTSQSGDRRAVAQAQLVRGTVAAQLGLGHWAQARHLDEADRSPIEHRAKRYFLQASEDLTEVRDYGIQEAYVAGQRIQAEPTPQAYADYEHGGMTALNAAHLHDQIAVARGEASRDFENTLDAVRNGLGPASTQSDAMAILERFRKRCT